MALLTSVANGSIISFNGTDWVKLGEEPSGVVLQSTVSYGEVSAPYPRSGYPGSTLESNVKNLISKFDAKHRELMVQFSYDAQMMDWDSWNGNYGANVGFITTGYIGLGTFGFYDKYYVPSIYNSTAMATCNVEQNRFISGSTRSGGSSAGFVNPSFPAKILPYIYVKKTAEVNSSNKVIVNNPPNLTIKTANGLTMYDNDSLIINGSVLDIDSGDRVNINFKIDNSANFVLLSSNSNGSNIIDINRPITFKNKMIYSGITAVTGVLSDGPHTLQIWATDSANESSQIHSVTFNTMYNRIPIIYLSTSNNLTLYEGDKMNISGSVSDSDPGDILTLKYQINNNSIQNTSLGASNGSSSLQFNSDIVFKNSMFYLSGSAITPALTKDVAHTLNVWVEDNKSGKSTVISRTFYVVPNRPPELKITSSTFPNFAWTAKELDAGDKVSNTEVKLNGVSIFKLANPIFPQVITVPITSLTDGENTLTITATDSFNSTSTKTLKLSKKYSSFPETQLTTAMPTKSKEVKINLKRPSGIGSSKIKRILGGFSL